MFAKAQALHRQGHLELAQAAYEALQAYDHAIALQPGHVSALTLSRHDGRRIYRLRSGGPGRRSKALPSALLGKGRVHGP